MLWVPGKMGVPRPVWPASHQRMLLSSGRLGPNPAFLDLFVDVMLESSSLQNTSTNLAPSQQQNEVDDPAERRRSLADAYRRLGAMMLYPQEPTADQQNSISRHLTATDRDEEGLLTCSICREDRVEGNEVVVPPCGCGNWFDTECFRRWLQDHHTCPACRASLLQ